ncbi:hypothetical protein TNCV_1056001 [Trichonephila clavipes]|nr:hypothetical protein TNCV_1056001 [Trichonephila clavipes]
MEGDSGRGELAISAVSVKNQDQIRASRLRKLSAIGRQWQSVSENSIHCAWCRECTKKIGNLEMGACVDLVPVHLPASELQNFSSGMSEVKLTEGIFVGRDIRKIVKDNEFETCIIGKER